MATVKIFKHHFKIQFLILFVVEAAILYAGSYIGAYFRVGELTWYPQYIDNLPVSAAVAAVVLMLGMVAMGQYQTQRPESRLLIASVVFRIAISLFLGSLALMILYYIAPALYLGRGVLLYTLVADLVLLTLARLIFYSTVEKNALRRNVLIYGAGEPAASLMSLDFNDNPLAPYNGSYVIHGFVPIDGEPVAVPEHYCVTPEEGLLKYCQTHDIDEVVVAVKDRRNNLPTNALLDCKLSDVAVIDFISFHEREKGMLHLDILQPSWMIFSDGYGSGGLRLAFGRLFDVLASSIILLITSPILFLTAVAIFLESGFKGPIFYRQKRVGFNNSEFDLLKFRSMQVDAEKDGKAVWAQKNDARVTFVGNFIRKTRIDEIPQLINVLKGEMSIVGPRPERPEFVADLEKAIPYYRLRHRVKPGLAGWAQIKYPYGASEKDAYNKLQFDLFYIKNRTLLMDMMVLLQTIEIVILGKGAR